MARFTAPEREAGFFIGEEEKAELIKQATQLDVKSVEVRANPFDGEKKQFVVTVELDDSERGLSFGEGVASRDGLLYALRDYLADEVDQEPVRIFLTQVKSKAGRPVNIVNVVGDGGDGRPTE
jgi:hypothetical protein